MLALVYESFSQTKPACAKASAWQERYRSDLEKIYADDLDFEDVAQRLAAIG